MTIQSQFRCTFALAIILTLSVNAAQGPVVTSMTPAPGSAINALPGSILLTCDNPINASTVTTQSILVLRSGPDGMLGNADDASVVPTSVSVINLNQLSIVLPVGSPQERYRVTATSAITNTAGDPLDGEFSGTFPSGNGVSGGNFVAEFLVLPTFAEVTTPMSSFGGRTVAIGDCDNDGWLDLMIYGVSNGSKTTRYYRNNQGTFVDTGITLPGYEEGQLEWGDFNNDGMLDIGQGGWDGGTTWQRVIRNDGNNVFTYIGQSFRGVKQGGGNWADFNNDGRLDLLSHGESYDSGSGYYALIHRNNGGNAFSLNQSLTGVIFSSSAVGDYDNDGAIDILIAGNNTTKLYRNNGSGSFSAVSTPFPGLTLYTATAFGDFDNSGKLGVVISGQSNSGNFSEIYRNVDGQFIALNANLAKLKDCRAEWGDYDNDGWLDLLVAGRTETETITRLYRNNQGTFQDSGCNFLGVSRGDAKFVDFDNDGRLDIIVCGTTAAGPLALKVYKNNTSTANTKPNAPANLQGTRFNQTAIFSWQPATDGQTPSAGLSYNLRVGTAPGKDDIFASMSNSDGTRKVLTLGNAQKRTTWTLSNVPSAPTLYSSVQAIDGSLAGSAWATEQELLTSLPPTTIAAVNQSATYSGSQQVIQLQANVTSPGGTVNDGTVTFQLKSGPTNIGTAVTSGTVTNGATGSVPYTIPGGSSAGSYSIVATYNPGTQFGGSFDNSKSVTVNPAPLNATGTNAMRVYGAPNPAFTGTLTGVQVGDGITATFASDANSLSSAGMYAIVPALSDPNNKLSNYAVTTVNGVLSVTRAPLTATAQNAERQYGDENPVFSGTIFGVLNNDNILGSFLSSATATSNVGAYAIVPTLLDPDTKLGNYNISYSNGTLFVVPAGLTVTAANAERPFAAPNPALTGTITGIKNNDPITATFTTTADATSDLGTYAITAMLNAPNGVLDNYAVTFNSGTLTVTPAIPPTLTSALQASATVGTNFTYIITADGSDPLTFSADNLPEGLSFQNQTITGAPSVAGVFRIPIGVANVAGSDSDVLRIIILRDDANAAPVINSLPTASPNPALAGGEVAFLVQATDSDGDVLEYAWDFGDGTSAVGASVLKIYAAAGVYRAAVAVSDGQFTRTSSVSVVIQEAPPIGTFTVDGVTLNFNFLKTNADSLTLQGSIPVPSPLPATLNLRVLIGLLEVNSTVDSKGRSTDGSFMMRAKGSSAKFSFRIKKSALFEKLSVLGFKTDSDDPALSFPVAIALGGQNYFHLSVLKYDAKSNKKGPTKGTARKAR